MTWRINDACDDKVTCTSVSSWCCQLRSKCLSFSLFMFLYCSFSKL